MERGTGNYRYIYNYECRLYLNYVLASNEGSLVTIRLVALPPYYKLSCSHSCQLSVCLYPPPFLSTRPSDHNQILQIYSDRYGTHSGGVRHPDDLGPTAWNWHLHSNLRFSGSSNHLIHAFLTVASLGNLCPPKLLHLGRGDRGQLQHASIVTSRLLVV